MRIIFIPSESAQHQSINPKIISFCEQNNHKLFDGTIDINASAEVIKKQTITLMSEIKQTDGVIFESSIPSFNQGRYLTLALQSHKPILLLYKNSLPTEFANEQNRLITTQMYEDESHINVDTAFKEFLKLVKKQRLLYRFNLMISKDLNSYLMDRARENGVSKADYIRQLIVQDMDITS